MNALRRIHEVLVPGGTLLDMHPIPPAAVFEAAGRELGVAEEDEFFELVAATEARLEETVATGLFAHERQVEFDCREWFDAADDLFEVTETWEGFEIPPGVRRRLLRAQPPLALRERVVLRSLRAL